MFSRTSKRWCFGCGLMAVLYDSFEVPKNLQEEVVSRIKVMARMNIAEKRLPQDGRASVQVGDQVVDLRVSSLPTRFGERVVIRLLDKSKRLFNLSDLGMDGQTLSQFRQLITAEHGIILVTGPTGSGRDNHAVLGSSRTEREGAKHPDAGGSDRVRP